MNTHEITVPTTQEDFLMSYLKSLNGLFNLTGKHIECLHGMILINKTLTGTKEIREQLVDVIKVKDVPAVTNLIKALKDKGALIEDRNNRCYKYHEALVPKSLEVKIKFKIV